MTSRRNGSNLLRVCTYARQPTLQYSKKTKKKKKKEKNSLHRHLLFKVGVPQP